MIETCLICKVAWDVSMDPPRCQKETHPHALNDIEDWNTVGHGLAADPRDFDWEMGAGAGSPRPPSPAERKVAGLLEALEQSVAAAKEARARQRANDGTDT